jgi:hypothetical protein
MMPQTEPGSGGMADRVLKALQSKYKNAMKVSAMTLNTLSDDATPTWNNKLRDSKRVRVNAWNDVDCITGDADTEAYAAYQYGVDKEGNEHPLRHEGTPQMYKDLSAGGANGEGTGSPAQYQRQYRKKRKEGVLQPSVAKWYKRVIEDPESVHTILTVFMKRFKQ